MKLKIVKTTILLMDMAFIKHKKQVSEGNISLKHSPLLKDWSTTASEGFWKIITDGSG